MKRFWLSFIDPELPEGSRFLGVCVVEGDDVVSAVQNAWQRGCNPGGEVAVLEFSEDIRVPDDIFNRLLNEKEANLAKARLEKLNTN